MGKSALALAAAPLINAEIVSADSRQVYRYLDVGTAKPTVAERAAVPHHMIDVVYPDQPFSIVDFRRGAEAALADVADRGHAAIVVGGSPHYLSALMDGLEPPEVSLPLRRWLERFDREQPSRLDEWLRVLDPISAGRIEPRNRRRVTRAVEATLASGEPFYKVRRRTLPAGAARWVGLRLERAVLHERVDRRIREMIDAGWLAEVRMLLRMGYSPDLPAMSATGYRELAQVVLGETSLQAAVERIRFATHAFIRRQESWLRQDQRIQWLNGAVPDLRKELVSQATSERPAPA